MVAIDYGEPGPLTTLDGISPQVLSPLPDDPVEICRPVSELVILPNDAQELELAAERFATNQIRPAAHLLRELLALDPAPVTSARQPQDRIIGTCRHFAVLACALLRHRGVPARVRCGFATYFKPGQGLDHWITEYRDDSRWVRVDAEVLGGTVLSQPDDVRPDEFLSGGEAWIAYRNGDLDASTFGVDGTQNWGAAEIRGNAVKDLAALNKVELLPWDEWGRMTEAYKGLTGPDYDELLDQLASTCATDDPTALAALYRHQDLTVPAELIR